VPRRAVPAPRARRADRPRSLSASVSALARFVFAGDRRVWWTAIAVGLPLAVLILVWCLVPRPYFTGTNSVDVYTYAAPTPRGQNLCIRGLKVPGGTAALRMKLISSPQTFPMRPRLHYAIRLGGRSLTRQLPAQQVPADRISAATVSLPPVPDGLSYEPASLCVRADEGLVNWGGASTHAGLERLPTVGGKPIPARVAVFFLPRPGAKRSYLSAAGDMFRRAALFRAGFVGPWLYALLFFVLLPGLVLLSVRTLAVAVAGGTRRFAVFLFMICALNASAWALITPAFHGPDEVDHFAYLQAMAEQGRSAARGVSRYLDWSGAEHLAVDASRMETDHLGDDSRAPWLESDVQDWRQAVAHLHPSRTNGGGYTPGAAAHGPIYYLALSPAYRLAGTSVFAELTLARLMSALVGALAAVFAYLIMLEFAPGRRWLGVMAALLVSFQPMYGFMSGVINNDVGVNAGAAAVELLLIRMVRRGLTVRSGGLAGLLLILIPLVKGTGYSLFPVAGVALLLALWRRHRRGDLLPAGVFLAAATATQLLWGRVSGVFDRAAFTTPSGASPVNTSAAGHQISGYLSYLWQVFLPRLSSMVPHFPEGPLPAYIIFVERGWGAFGWYAIYFPGWVYDVIEGVMLAVPLLALVSAVREWSFFRRHVLDIGVLVLMPLAVVAGVEYAYYTPGTHELIPEFGRYAFPGIAPLAVLVIASLHAFGRRALPIVGTVLVMAMMALSYAGQLLMLTRFYA
jgi:hypothetical protein